ncbi:unnamed protein product [Brassica oleracea]
MKQRVTKIQASNLRHFLSEPALSLYCFVIISVARFEWKQRVERGGTSGLVSAVRLMCGLC